jgi:hypothetical protein
MMATKTQSKVLLRDSKGHFVGSGSKKAVSATNLHSSFIKSLKIEGTIVNVVMNRNPNTSYCYKPTPQGLIEVKKILTQGGSLGVAYNQFLRGTEVSRTIYAK